MPRQSRIDTPGALHHIIARGIERRQIFDDDQDRYSFLERIALILKETLTTCYAWALIPNHFHLLLKTGTAPVATVMRRLLTGHALAYNRRHGRNGHLFQNRYKSILCQEDLYFLQLVRYIHLNPLRAGLVKDLTHLDKYPFSGHGVIMGRNQQDWQSSDAVLACFGSRRDSARSGYRAFVAKGIGQGKRQDLTGGGFIRSIGGWDTVKVLRKTGGQAKSDERILGDSDFVRRTLSENKEAVARQYSLRSRGVDVDFIAQRVALLLHLPVGEVWAPGRYKHLVTARSLICYWAVRELGVSQVSLARRFNISEVAISKSVRRGAEIVKREGYDLGLS
jgi:REP element-mobilizing transposase RayT